MIFAPLPMPSIAFTTCWHCFAMLCVAQACGCDARTYRLTEVSGKVTRAGQPVAGLSVTFQPAAGGQQGANPGPGSAGLTDAEGRYQLATIENSRRLGAVVGPHQVFITAFADRDLPDGVRPLSNVEIPSRFHDGSIKFEVPREALSNADFDLGAR